MKLQSVLALIALVLVSACGKSMHLTSIQNNANAGGLSTSAEVKPTDAATQATDPSGVKVTGSLSSLAPDDYTNALIFTAANIMRTADRVDNLGIASMDNTQGSLKLSDGQEVPYSSYAVEVVTATLDIPAADQIESVKSLKLVLKGLTRSSPMDQDQADLSGQILCVVDGMLCSGDGTNVRRPNDLRMLSTDFSSISGLKAVGTSNSLKIFTKDTDVTIDLKSALSLSDQAALEFLTKNSIEGKTPGQRVFRLALGKQSFVQGGELQFEYVSKKSEQK
jgi:hypothetical protein